MEEGITTMFPTTRGSEKQEEVMPLWFFGEDGEAGQIVGEGGGEVGQKAGEGGEEVERRLVTPWRCRSKCNWLSRRFHQCSRGRSRERFRVSSCFFRVSSGF
jgi:hypothetical protein